MAPRGTTNMTDWNNAVSMNLSVEAVGQLLNHMNHSKECNIELDQTSLACIPLENKKGSFKIIVKYEERSVEMILHGGEIEVVKSLIQCAIPQLVAWDTLILKSFEGNLEHAKNDY